MSILLDRFKQRYVPKNTSAVNGCSLPGTGLDLVLCVTPLNACSANVGSSAPIVLPDRSASIVFCNKCGWGFFLDFVCLCHYHQVLCCPVLSSYSCSPLILENDSSLTFHQLPWNSLPRYLAETGQKETGEANSFPSTLLWSMELAIPRQYPVPLDTSWPHLLINVQEHIALIDHRSFLWVCQSF